jgi:hypothetical protein
VIQLSPPIETADVSAGELIHKPKPEKKDGLGVFAKILAGLLRKAGEKDAPSISGGEKAGTAKIAHPKAGDAESADSEALSALFPGLAGWAEGKKPGKTGASDSGSPGRVLETKNRKPEEKISGPEGDWSLASPPPFDLSGTSGAEAAGEAGGAKPPVKTGRSLPGTEGISGEPALELSLSRNSPGAGLPPETWLEAETGEPRMNRKGKTGKPGFLALSPEEAEGSGPNRISPGAHLTDMKKSGAPEGGKDGGGRSTESRFRDKRRDRVNLEIRDLRTGGGPPPDSTSGTHSAQNTAGGARSFGETGETEIVLELRGDNAGGEAPDSAQNSWESRSAQSFEQTLARELHENLNGDIVRHASMVLRDKGQGTIRLSLKPESLGNVKIRLEMAENKITGHIVVESEEALRAFEREVRSLEQAFRDSGFEGAELDMSLAQGGGGAGDRRNGEETGRSFLSERMAASQYDAALEHSEHPGLFAADARNGMYTRNGRIAVNMLI